MAFWFWTIFHLYIIVWRIYGIWLKLSHCFFIPNSYSFPTNRSSSTRVFKTWPTCWKLAIDHIPTSHKKRSPSLIFIWSVASYGSFTLVLCSDRASCKVINAEFTHSHCTQKQIFAGLNGIFNQWKKVIITNKFVSEVSMYSRTVSLICDLKLWSGDEVCFIWWEKAPQLRNVMLVGWG